MLLCDPDTHLPPVQLQLPSFLNLEWKYHFWDNSISVEWKKLNVFKMRFTTFYKFWNYYLVVNGVAYQYHWPDNRNTTWYPSSLPVVPYELITTSATRLCSPHWGSFQSWNAKVWLSAPSYLLRSLTAHRHDDSCSLPRWLLFFLEPWSLGQ